MNSGSTLDYELWINPHSGQLLRSAAVLIRTGATDATGDAGLLAMLGCLRCWAACDAGSLAMLPLVEGN